MNMITDIGRFIVEVIGYLWPLQLVWQWERGAYYICGKYWRDLNPGCYPCIPFFMDVRATGAVSMTFVTPLKTVDLSDGSTLTYSASFKLRIVDLGAAYNNVLDWDETAMEDTAAALSEKLGDVDVARLDVSVRRKLCAACKKMLDAELGEYGLAVDRLRFDNFVRNMPVYRLFNDQGYSSH